MIERFEIENPVSTRRAKLKQPDRKSQRKENDDILDTPNLTLQMANAIR